jgi:alkylated DNA repair dioxygenase AlkB
MSSLTAPITPVTETVAPDRHPDPLKSGISLYDPTFLPQADANRLFAALIKLPWQQHIITMYGKRIPAPRMYQWMGIPPQPRASHGEFKTEGGIYAGETFTPIGWTPEALEIRQRIHHKLGILYDSLNINKYRNGEDYLGWHIDKEDEGR